MTITKMIEYAQSMIHAFTTVFDFVFVKTFEELEQYVTESLNMNSVVKQIVDGFFSIIFGLFNVEDITIFEFMFEVGIGFIVIYTIAKWFVGLVK